MDSRNVNTIKQFCDVARLTAQRRAQHGLSAVAPDQKRPARTRAALNGRRSTCDSPVRI